MFPGGPRPECFRYVSLFLGGHSIGVFHCKFFRSHLNNLSRITKLDLSADSAFLNFMRPKCNMSAASETPAASRTGSPPLGPVSPAAMPSVSLSSSYEDPGISMANEECGVDFGTLYYRSLLHNGGILYSDQQLMAREETGIWVRAYASDISLFRNDFAHAMMKLSNLQVLTGSAGQIMRSCSKLV